MSDTVDDLHAAEDFAGTAVAVLADIVRLAERRGAVIEVQRVISDARMVVEHWATYCRPTCNPNDDGDHDVVCEEGPTCGCPCRDRAQEAIDADDHDPLYEEVEPPERELPGEEP